MLSGNSDTHLRILLVDDHEVVRLGLRALLSRYPQFEVVAEAGDGDEALEKTLYYEPDVVVMDIRLPGKSGVEATEEIMRHRPETRVVMLTSYAEDDVLFDAIAAGAAGYVLKQIGSDDLVRALMTVGRGESLLDPAVTQKVFQKMRSNARQVEDEYFSMLTEQELTILALMTDGLTNKEIARRVFLSEKTVRNYVSRSSTSWTSPRGRKRRSMRCAIISKAMCARIWAKRTTRRASRTNCLDSVTRPAWRRLLV